MLVLEAFVHTCLSHDLPLLYLFYTHLMYSLSHSLPALPLHLVALIPPVLYSVKQASKSDHSICPLLPVEGIPTCNMHSSQPSDCTEIAMQGFMVVLQSSIWVPQLMQNLNHIIFLRQLHMMVSLCTPEPVTHGNR